MSKLEIVCKLIDDAACLGDGGHGSLFPNDRAGFLLGLCHGDVEDALAHAMATDGDPAVSVLETLATM